MFYRISGEVHRCGCNAQQEGEGQTCFCFAICVVLVYFFCVVLLFFCVWGRGGGRPFFPPPGAPGGAGGSGALHGLPGGRVNRLLGPGMGGLAEFGAQGVRKRGPSFFSSSFFWLGGSGDVKFMGVKKACGSDRCVGRMGLGNVCVTFSPRCDPGSLSHDPSSFGERPISWGAGGNMVTNQISSGHPFPRIQFVVGCHKESSKQPAIWTGPQKLTQQQAWFWRLEGHAPYWFLRGLPKGAERNPLGFPSAVL